MDSLKERKNDIMPITDHSELESLPGVVDRYYTASNDLLKSNDPEYQDSSTNWTKIKEIQVPGGVVGSEFRIKFDMMKFAGAGSTYAKIYVNGIARGTEYGRSVATWSTKSDDINGIMALDLIQLYVKNDSGVTGKFKNFRVYGALQEAYSSDAPDWS